MLWNRSLVMMDQETESLWSHILGRAMQGKLEGTDLEVLPAAMVTWAAWRRDHPQTTVLDMPRTSKRFTDEFYRDPGEFVFGWVLGRQAYSCSFETLQAHPVLNFELGGQPLLLTFDPEGASPQIFSRQLDGKDLRFEAEDARRMRDAQTGSIWNRSTGECLEGELKGKRLAYEIGMVSYAWAWRTFHPDSRTVTHGGR